MFNPADFFTPEERDEILSAIRRAEQETSGEIRLFIDRRCGENILDRAAAVFKELKMHETSARNGVLFYLAAEDKKFAILGDAGIHARVHHGFWDGIKEEMQEAFRESRFAEGLCRGIIRSGEALKKYFPRSKNDINELPDEFVFGK